MKKITESKAYWNEQKAKLNCHFAIFTYEDLLFDERKRDAIFRKLQMALGKPKEELLNIKSQ
ncbi:MAG: general stress protein CsbD [Bacteroidales bacterium]|nr:general stress protein CsbD [Bacteroidales bacterium]MCF8455705.1 general stress protein CsbD [Bacteroidales bacterium]